VCACFAAVPGVEGSSVTNVRRHPLSCRICGVSTFDGVHISARGKCPDCAEAREVANHRQLKAHRGPFFDWWRLRSLAALGDLRELLDSTPPASDTPD
jgi:hypothetical protein